MILDDDLDPDLVSATLALQPDQAWRRGEQHRSGDPNGEHLLDSYYKWGGWKKFIAVTEKDASLSEQIAYWVELLLPRREGLKELRALEYYLSLACFITPYEGGAASIIFEPDLLRYVGNMGLEIRLAFSS